MGGTLRGLGVVPETVGGVQDHIHLLMSGRTTDAPAGLIRELKKASSVWVAENYDPLFAWQEGYAIFSVSWTHAMALRNYIARQEQHHRRLPFVDELRRLLGKNGVSYELKYLE